MNVQMVLSHSEACGYYRIQIPAKGLRQRGCNVTVSDFQDLRLQEKTQVVVLQRHYGWSSVADLIKDCQVRGKWVVYDLDDDFFNIPPSNPGYQLSADPRFNQIITDALQAANVVTCSTQGLAQKLKIYAGFVKVLPNVLEKINPPRGFQPSGRDRKVIGWAGTPTHNDDLSMILPAVERLLQEVPEVDFCFLGEVPRQFVALGRRLPGRRILEVKPVNMSDYPAKLMSLKWDVGIIPLLNDDFNQSKSVVKFLEYTAAGVPSVVSAVGEYASLPKDVCKQADYVDTWFEAMKEMVRFPGYRQQYLRKAIEYVSSCRLLEHVQGRWDSVCRGNL